MMKLGIGFTQKNGETEETTVEVSSPQLVHVNLLALLYIPHA